MSELVVLQARVRVRVSERESGGEGFVATPSSIVPVLQDP